MFRRRTVIVGAAEPVRRVGIDVEATSDNVKELELKAYGEARVAFGPGVPLEISDSYTVTRKVLWDGQSLGYYHRLDATIRVWAQVPETPRGNGQQDHGRWQ